MKQVTEFVKKHYMLCICVMSFVLLVIVFPWMEKKGTYSLSAEDEAIAIACQTGALAGEEVTCAVILNTRDRISKVSANYVLPEELTYVSFEVSPHQTYMNGGTVTCMSDNCFLLETGTSEGFTVRSDKGYSTGNIVIGTLTLALSNDVIPDAEYEVKLTDIEITEEENDSIAFDDVSATIRVASNIATLDAITLSDGTLNETFVSDVFNYTATVPASVSVLTVYPVPTQEGEIITGVTRKELHYGTNTFTLSVMSEDESVTNEYTINVFRKYAFSTDVYTYDSEGEYIYTRSDTGDSIIANLEELEDGLAYEIASGYLKVKYNDEVLVNLKILNFSCEYEIINKLIYIENTLTYETLLGKITSDSMVVKLINADGEEVTNNSTIVNGLYTLEIYYNDHLIDSFGFVDEYLSVGGNFIVDGSHMVFQRLPLGMTYGTLLNYLHTTGSIELIAHDNIPLTNDDIVRTGDKVKITFSNSSVTYTLSVLGDITGNGVVKIGDVGTLYKYYRERIDLDYAYAVAGDIYNDGNIKIGDVGTLYKYYRGKMNSLEE